MGLVILGRAGISAWGYGQLAVASYYPEAQMRALGKLFDIAAVGHPHGLGIVVI